MYIRTQFIFFHVYKQFLSDSKSVNAFYIIEFGCFGKNCLVTLVRNRRGKRARENITQLESCVNKNGS